jgi:hypothetical protein
MRHHELDQAFADLFLAFVRDCFPGGSIRGVPEEELRRRLAGWLKQSKDPAVLKVRDEVRFNTARGLSARDMVADHDAN